MPFPRTIAPGASAEITVRFDPSAVGARTGTLTVLSNAPGSPHTRALTGSGGAPVVPPPAITWLTADGTLLKDAAGNEVLLRSCNYYGLEQAGVPYGVWTQPYRTITVGGVTTEGMLDKMKRVGFNSIRLLVSVDMTMQDVDGNFFVARTNPAPTAWNSTFVNAALNPDLATADLATGNVTIINVIAILDKLVDHCEAIGLRVILDMHCLAADSDNVVAMQGKWYSTATPFAAPAGDRWVRFNEGSRRNETQFIDAWKFYADRYKTRPIVCGFDLINEPHNSTWDRNASTGLVGIYERVGAEIHAINPNVLLICQGSATPPELAWNFDASILTGETTWGSVWSGYLQKVRDTALRVGSSAPGVVANKVVYSPHEYGAEVGSTGPNWFTSPLKGDAFPDNLREVWRQQWGYLAEENIAPVWIGEYGSTWRVGDNGYTTGKRAKDEQWLLRLADYCHTFRIGTAFWGFVPDIIGGLVESDFTTLRTDKLPFVQRFFDPMPALVAPIPIPAPHAPVVGGGGGGGGGGDPADGTPTGTAPSGWAVVAPSGLTVTYTPRTRGGVLGTLIAFAGTTSAGGAISISTNSGKAAAASDNVTYSFSGYVDDDDAAITSISSALSEFTGFYVWVATDTADWWSGRLTVAPRSVSRVMTAGATSAQGSIITNSIGSGAALSFSVWVGNPQIV